ncbi:Protein of unknown function (DUF3006) [Halobacteroides halobius DSM 5150]|uniref:DUF3006 domain-containing protein n=1 Tax=Halobacteroides halobius (strain ATCC 35273 / DSM 5150 / MD-1) TaxID=748449 RepID=L0K9M7_HALHC|nr:DUF3006 domain-containing protein [Halobacteroides halobius]AGB41074.1 Protein of unknown function (DUF3006) [Halobacteroides halobius DSM 5150]
MLIIDRFEGDKVIIEYNNQTFNLPKSVLPKQAKEGDVVKLIIDQIETNNKKQRVKELANELFE